MQGEELIMQQQQQTVQTHHQVVEEIMPEQMSDEVTKEVINQFLPQRKRKPRAPKQPKQPAQKMIKLEPQASGSETITTTITSGTIDETGAEMIVEEQVGDQVTEMVEQVTGDEEQQLEQQGGEMCEQNTSSVSVKSEGTPKTPKDKSIKKGIGMQNRNHKNRFS